MMAPARPGIVAVAVRELRWMRRDGLALFLAIGVPLIAFTILAFTFSNAVIRNLPVNIVDADRTATSRLYVQAVASAPGVRVAHRSDTLTSAMGEIRSGDAVAAVYIPPNFERDLVDKKRPQIVVFYNRQFLTPGNNASSSLSSAINATTDMLAPASHAKPIFKLGSLVPEEYVLSNPALNFVQFLLRAVMPMVLHVVIAISAGYAVGSEFTRRSMRAWLRTAGGSPLAALIGKLAPLFAIFIVMMAVEAGIIHGVFQIPFRGGAAMMGAAACLLVIAYLSVGALFQLLLRNLALGLSVTAIFCSPAFGFVGVGFPILGMNGFARFWGDLLPLRWYMEILFDQALRGLPPAVSALPFAILGALAIGYFGLAWLRLRGIATLAPVRVPPPPSTSPRYPAFGIGGAMVAEFRRVLSDQGALGMILLAPIIYGLFYPQPYLGQVLRDLPVAVVDLDRTELSRNLVQTLNADEAVKVA
ncbi:MAG: ABC transporter permease, partial [Rhodomicrobium sp.]